MSQRPGPAPGPSDCRKKPRRKSQREPTAAVRWGPLLARFTPAEVIDRELARTRTIRRFERRWGWVPGVAAGGSFALLLPWGLFWSLIGAFVAGASLFVWIWRRRAALDAGRDLGAK